MARRLRPWIAPPHDPIQQHHSHLWSVTGQIPGLPGQRRRMVIAKRAAGELVFFNAVPLSEPAMAALAGLGAPGLLVVPNAYHRMDAHAFRERLQLRVLCDDTVATRVQKVVPVDGGPADLSNDGRVRIAPLSGTRQGELVLVVTRPGDEGNTSLAFADAFMNVPKGSGVLNALLGVSGGAKCPPIFRNLFVADRRRVAQQLAELAALPGLARLLPSHGEIVERDAAATLRMVIARDLG